jgi:hypothetical protein
MIRTLVMIAVAGFLLSVVCLSVAIGMAGPEFIERGAWSWTGHGWDYDWDRNWDHSFGFSFNDGPTESRTLPWSGEAMEVDLPADVTFTQAAGPASVIVHGSKAAVDSVTVADGRIAWTRHGLHRDRLEIEVTAPKVTRFQLNSSGDLQIRDYRQDALTIRAAGASDITASGTTKTAELALSGSGDADLSGLAAEGADVRVSGSGDVKVGPSAWAKIDISGSGDVTLTSRPARQETHVSGSGSIEQQGAAGADSEDEPDERT